MPKKLDDLKAALFSAKDGAAACDAINTLNKRATKGDGQETTAAAGLGRPNGMAGARIARGHSTHYVTLEFALDLPRFPDTVLAD